MQLYMSNKMEHLSYRGGCGICTYIGVVCISRVLRLLCILFHFQKIGFLFIWLISSLRYMDNNISIYACMYIFADDDYWVILSELCAGSYIHVYVFKHNHLLYSLAMPYLASLKYVYIRTLVYLCLRPNGSLGFIAKNLHGCEHVRPDYACILILLF